MESRIKPRISAVINTLNEERNLPIALRSVQPWVDEIVVVDMYSEDRTVEIAQKFGAKIFFHERMGFVEPARSYAVEQTRGDWVLILDADEVIPYSLSRALLRIADSNTADIVRIPRLNYVLGAPIMHTNWGPDQDSQLRFFRKGCFRTTATIHAGIHPAAGSRTLALRLEPGVAIVHFSYSDSKQFIEKMNSYTSIEANQAFERGERRSPLGALARGVKEFGVRYIKGSGFRDGWRGFYISIFMAFYRIATAAKLHELTVLGERARIEEGYRQEAQKILKAYSETQSTAPS